MGSAAGETWTRVGAVSKLSGQAVYAADIHLPGMLWGKMLGSPFAHARIKAVNLEKARRVQGVLAVIRGQGFPYLHGECLVNMPFLAIDKVRYIGEPVAAAACRRPGRSRRGPRTGGAGIRGTTGGF